MENEQTKKAVNRSRHLTAAQSAEAISLWAAGNVTLEQLCERYKKDKSTMIRFFNKSGVAKGEKAEEQSKKIAQEIEKSVVDDAAKIAERIRETKEDSYKLAKAIERLISGEIIDARSKGLPISSKAANIKTLVEAAKGLKMTREERYAILDIGGDTGEEEVPDLEIKELTVEEIKAIQQASLQESKEDDLDVPDMDIMLADGPDIEDDVDGVTT